MKGKRGKLSWDEMGKWLLLLFLLGIILVVVFTPLFPKTKEYLDLIMGQINETEFTPYEEEISFEEGKVDNSMNALTCAMYSTALGSPAWEAGYCDAGYIDATQTETSSVTARASSDLTGEEIPPCDGILYGTVCVECETSREFRCSVKGFELPQSGIHDFNLAEKWIQGANDPEYIVYYEAFPMGEEAAWQIDRGSFWIDVVLFGAGLNTIVVAGQLARARKGVGLVTREFGEAIARKGVRELEQESFEAAMRETGQALGRELSEDAISEFAEVFGRRGYQRLLRSEIMYTEVLEGLEQEVAEQARSTVVKKWGIYSRLGKSADETVDLLRRDVAKALGESSFDDLLPSQRRVLGSALRKMVTQSLDEKTEILLKNRQAIKQFWAREFLDETGEKLSREAIEKLFSRAVSKELLDQLGPEATEQFVRRALTYTNDMLLKEVIEGSADSFATRAILGVKNLPDLIARDFENFGREIYNLNAEKLMRFTTGVELSNARAVASKLKTVSGMWEVAKTTSPIQLRWKTSILSIPRPVLWRSLGATTLQLTGAAELAWRSRVSRYILAYHIGGLLAQADARNEKYKSKGINTLIVNQPYLFESSREYNLGGLDGYYVNLIKEGRQNARFYLASPCKTDLTVYTTTGSCELENGPYLLKSTKQPVEPGSINYDFNYVEKIYNFDDLTGDIKRSRMLDCLTINLGGCLTTLMENPVLFDESIKYIYDNVYVPGLKFVNDYEVKATNELDKLKPPSYHIHNFDQNLERNNKENLRNDPNYGGFAVLADQNVGLFFDQFLGEKTPYGYYEVRETPVDYTTFYEGMSVEISHRWYYEDILFRNINNIIFRVYARMYLINRDPQLNFFNDLLVEDSVLWNTAREYYFHYYLLDDTRIDKTNAIKLCEVPELGKTTENILDVQTTTARVTIPTIAVQTNMRSYRDWNEGTN